MSKLYLGIVIVCAIAFFAVASAILPGSPFLTYMNYSSLSAYLPYINYFVPVDEIIVMSEAWLAAVGLFLTFQFGRKSLQAVSDCTDLKPL